MNNNHHVEISINPITLERLICEQALSLKDLSCLNPVAKQVVHRSFLNSLKARFSYSATKNS